MGSPKRILILDGDPQVEQKLRESLSAPDWEFHTTPEELGSIALAPFQLILAGTVAALVCAKRVWPQTPVIVVAATATPEEVIQAIQTRAYALFRVPHTVSALTAMVEHALDTPVDEDDIEVLSARPAWLGFKIRCKRDAADRIVQFLRESILDLGAPHQENCVTAIREILANAIEHGGGLDPAKSVSIACVRTGRALLCNIRDPGNGFSFEQLPHAAVSNPADSPFGHAEVRNRLGMRPGGFGIMLARSLVDELIYDQTGNEVLLVKYLPAES
jgi:anti-sigma regulatory factor (Ser/Thr protein kinase)